MECIMFKNGMRPVHPGEILLEDYIKPMGVSVRAVAIALHVPYSRLSEITKGERGVSADTALRLERYFGSEAQGWLALQAAYDLRTAEKQNAKLISREIEPLVMAT
jgi:addiction module HigA family antidote